MRGTIAPGVEPGLEATAYFAPPYGATGSGAVALILEVDPETIEVKIQRYAIVHDCGTVINPLLLEGQIQGAVSMGLGNVWYEKMFYDENGQLLTASFMDYLMPQATDMPDKIEIGHAVNTTPLNPLGIKGVGEAGAIPTPPAFIQALEDALPEYKLELLESNLNPGKVFEYMHKVKS
jgi:aerobic carbon-monoxide dehydrogenase large subunit